MTKRIPNKLIDQAVTLLHPFENYNGTIEADIINGETSRFYRVRHWRTIVLTYDIERSEIVGLTPYFISQTTSTLMGRLLRNLPREAVLTYIYTAPLEAQDRKRLKRMVRA